MLNTVDDKIKSDVEGLMIETETRDSVHLLAFILNFFEVACNDIQLNNLAAKIRGLTDLREIIKLTKNLMHSVNICNSVKFDEWTICKKIIEYNQFDPYTVDKWENNVNSTKDLKYLVKVMAENIKSVTLHNIAKQTKQKIENNNKSNIIKCEYCHKKGHSENQCYIKQNEDLKEKLKQLEESTKKKKFKWY